MKNFIGIDWFWWLVAGCVVVGLNGCAIQKTDKTFSFRPAGPFENSYQPYADAYSKFTEYRIEFLKSCMERSESATCAQLAESLKFELSRPTDWADTLSGYSDLALQLAKLGVL